MDIKVNGKTWPVEASADTPLLYVLTNELRLKGPRFGCGLAQCGSCSVLADGVEIRSCVTPVAAVASAAAGVHRRAGTALRLLLQRHADQGLRALGAESAPDRS